MENAPDFVRPGIYKLMAKKAKEKGYKVITSKFLSEIRDESMMMVTKRMKKLGFDDLNMMAFDKAKDKMKDSRKTEVIGIIKQFLAERTGKNEEIIKKFENTLVDSQIKISRMSSFSPYLISWNTTKGAISGASTAILILTH